MTPGAPDSSLRSLVQRYQVCWDSFAEWSKIGDDRKQTGVVIELYGTHGLGGVVPTAGCRHCIPVIQALLAIADDVADLARQELVSIRAHTGIEYAIERGARPDIVVALTFGVPGSQSVAELEAPLTKVRQRLEELGASERSWHPPRA